MHAAVLPITGPRPQQPREDSVSNSSTHTNTGRNLAILLFDEAEVLDFCGPFEVFSVAASRSEPSAFNVFTVAETAEPVRARNGLTVVPHYALSDSPSPQILLVPGGYGTRSMMDNAAVIGWIARKSESAELVLSVCTGALLLAKAGLLDSLEVTTHRSACDLLRRVAPESLVRENRRFIDNGNVITSAGIAAGIDMSLHVVARLLGEHVAIATAEHMEYPFAG